MRRCFPTLSVALFAFALTIGFGFGLPSGAGRVVAQTADTSEKSAFDSAKELGTVDAWNAFLKSFPTGFHADLARAYLKKQQEPPPPDAFAGTSSSRVGERRCSEQRSLRSEKSTEPTKITFINNSGMYRSILWIDYDGRTQSYGGVNSGDRVTFDTYRTHPWMIATGPGDCLQIFLPAAEPGSVELVRLAADDRPGAVRDVQRAQSPPPQQTQKRTAAQPIRCAQNYKLINGNCVLLQNCGKNAYRSPEGDCYCSKGYRMVNGACVWPTDSKGFEVAPWKKSGCSSLQAQCKQGNGSACKKYEETCQVN